MTDDVDRALTAARRLLAELDTGDGYEIPPTAIEPLNELRAALAELAATVGLRSESDPVIDSGIFDSMAAKGYRADLGILARAADRLTPGQETL